MGDNLDIIDLNNVQPPRYLYKYLSPDRFENVLEGGTVRFTPLMNSNDSFEIRSTFHTLAGPRFIQLLYKQLDAAVAEEKLESMIADVLQKNGFNWIPVSLARYALEVKFGRDFVNVLRSQMQTAVDSFLIPQLNSKANLASLLERFGREFLCFSLSERYDIAPMWAHYADSGKGFVVAFDTENEWFTLRKTGEKSRLQKVTYFDGKVEEPLENVPAALISKTSEWEYEREWRLYIREQQVDVTIATTDDPIYLLSFPAKAVQRIIVGEKASAQLVERIRLTIAEKYPHALLTKVIPNRDTHVFEEMRI
jgi:Protein of unknown function (DUF2971)